MCLFTDYSSPFQYFQGNSREKFDSTLGHSSSCVPVHPTKSMPSSHSLFCTMVQTFTHYSHTLFFFLFFFFLSSSTLIENKASVVQRHFDEKINKLHVASNVLKRIFKYAKFLAQQHHHILLEPQIFM